MTATPADDATQSQLARGHVPALDGVRGLAILVVLIHNTAFILDETGLLPLKLFMAGTATGWAGVQLFFVLSGFLITGILADALGRPRFFRTFYIRRTLRIFPLYYGVLLVVVVWATTRVAPTQTSGASVTGSAAATWAGDVIQHQGWYWTYLSNWVGPFGIKIGGLSHFWSLAVEEQFYLVWPALIVLLGTRGLSVLAVLIVVLTPLIRLLMYQAGLPPLALYEWTIARWDALAAGALLALLMRQDATRRSLARWMPALAALALAGLATVTLLQRGFRERDLMVQVAGQSFIAMASACLIWCAVAPGGGFSRLIERVMSGGWLRFFGRYSYAMYVFHFPMHLLLMPHFTDWVNGTDDYLRLLRVAAYIGIVTAAATVAALISWRILEQPMLELKERLAPSGRAETSGARARRPAG